MPDPTQQSQSSSAQNADSNTSTLPPTQNAGTDVLANQPIDTVDQLQSTETISTAPASTSEPIANEGSKPAASPLDALVSAPKAPVAPAVPASPSAPSTNTQPTAEKPTSDAGDEASPEANTTTNTAEPTQPQVQASVQQASPDAAPASIGPNLTSGGQSRLDAIVNGGDVSAGGTDGGGSGKQPADQDMSDGGGAGRSAGFMKKYGKFAIAGVALLVVGIGTFATMRLIGTPGSADPRSQAEGGWCNADPVDTNYGSPCEPEGAIDCGGDGKQTYCKDGTWHATGLCCGDQPTGAPTANPTGTNYCAICSPLNACETYNLNGQQYQTGNRCLPTDQCANTNQSWQPDYDFCEPNVVGNPTPSPGDGGGGGGSVQEGVMIYSNGETCVAGQAGSGNTSLIYYSVNECVCDNAEGTACNELNGTCSVVGSGTLAAGEATSAYCVSADACSSKQIDVGMWKDAGLQTLVDGESGGGVIAHNYPASCGELPSPTPSPVPSATPTPTPPPTLACLELSYTPATTELGTELTFTCAETVSGAAADYANFQISNDGGTFSELPRVDDFTATLLIDDPGSYMVRCQVCQGVLDAGACTDWQVIGGAAN